MAERSTERTILRAALIGGGNAWAAICRLISWPGYCKKPPNSGCSTPSVSATWRFPATRCPRACRLPLAVSGTTWTSIGPTSSNKIQNGTTRTEVNSGRLRTILPDSADVETLYLLTAGGGLWKTSNLSSATPSWTALTDALGSTAGGAAAFGRVTTGASTVIYLGAGDAFDSNVGGFVTKSTNAGGAWSLPIQLNATSVLDLKVDTSTVNDIVLVGTNNGLFRSNNGGGA